jgi:hypothetical protein
LLFSIAVLSVECRSFSRLSDNFGPFCDQSRDGSPVRFGHLGKTTLYFLLIHINQAIIPSGIHSLPAGFQRHSEQLLRGHIANLAGHGLLVDCCIPRGHSAWTNVCFGSSHIPNPKRILLQAPSFSDASPVEDAPANPLCQS